VRISESLSAPLFDTSLNAQQAALDRVADSVRRSLRRDADRSQQGRQAAQQPSRQGGLGSGGATVPQSGAVGPSRPSSLPIPEGSSSVRRWSLLGRIQKLCRPDDPDERGPSVCGCGRPGYEATSVNIHFRCDETSGEFRAGVSGVYRCGSPWLCPVCAVGKAFERAERVQEMAVATYARGGQVGLLVLTASHNRKQSLAEVKTLVQTASGKARKGRAWIDAQADYGILGVVVGQEVTYGNSGWHYHQHLSVPVDGPTDAEKALAGGDPVKLEEIVRKRAYKAVQWLAGAYKASIRAAGGKVSDKHGCVFRVADDWEDASDYTAKGSLAWEIAGAHKSVTKSEKGMTPWDIAEAAAAGDAFMRHRWQEYVEVMPGTRSCVVSASLAKALDIQPTPQEKKDGEQELHERDDIVGRVDAPVWRIWMRHGLAATFLSRIEVGGAAPEEFAAAVAATERDAAPLERAWLAECARREAVKQLQMERDRPRREAERRARLAPHAPSPEHVARLAKGHRRDGQGAGAAIRAALDRERGVADSLGRRFETPAMRLVLELMAA
jgi:hypothetical protein